MSRKLRSSEAPEFYRAYIDVRYKSVSYLFSASSALIYIYIHTHTRHAPTGKCGNGKCYSKIRNALSHTFSAMKRYRRRAIELMVKRDRFDSQQLKFIQLANEFLTFDYDTRKHRAISRQLVPYREIFMLYAVVT